MNVSISFNGVRYIIDLSHEIDISIPVRFDDKQLQAFGAPPAQALPFQGDDFTVSVAAGAGCNCPIFTFAAHLHGTHTECVGHISKQNHIVQDVVEHQEIIPALLISVDPINAVQCDESYSQDFDEKDFVMTRDALEKVVQNNFEAKALIIRTLPNDEDKKQRDYDAVPPAFFTNEAMEFINQQGFEHVLLDTPSVDRLNDGGALSNHHIFWDVEQGSNDVVTPSSRSITEFIYVPEATKDGLYALQLNIGNIRSDAAPSRPVLYEMEAEI